MDGWGVIQLVARPKQARSDAALDPWTRLSGPVNGAAAVDPVATLVFDLDLRLAHRVGYGFGALLRHFVGNHPFRDPHLLGDYRLSARSSASMVCFRKARSALLTARSGGRRSTATCSSCSPGECSGRTPPGEVPSSPRSKSRTCLGADRRLTSRQSRGRAPRQPSPQSRVDNVCNMSAMLRGRRAGFGSRPKGKPRSSRTPWATRLRSISGKLGRLQPIPIGRPPVPLLSRISVSRRTCSVSCLCS
jgi:hypothetical protein